jgi:hypothetical protein
LPAEKTSFSLITCEMPFSRKLKKGPKIEWLEKGKKLELIS